MQRRHESMLTIDQIVGAREITPAQAEANRLAGRRGRRPRAAIPGLLPMSRSSWWNGIRDGRYPPPDIRAPGRCYWRESSIMRLLDDLAGHREAA